MKYTQSSTVRLLYFDLEGNLLHVCCVLVYTGVNNLRWSAFCFCFFSLSFSIYVLSTDSEIAWLREWWILTEIPGFGYVYSKSRFCPDFSNLFSSSFFFLSFFFFFFPSPPPPPPPILTPTPPPTPTPPFFFLLLNLLLECSG